MLETTWDQDNCLKRVANAFFGYIHTNKATNESNFCAKMGFQLTTERK